VRRALAALAAAAAVIASAGAVCAQAPAGAGRKPREEAFRMIDAYIVSNLQESLLLSDDQFAKLLPLVKRLQRDRRELVQRRIQALMEMRRTMGQGVATEARVEGLLRELKAVEVEEPATIRRDMDAIDALLSPLQQAKYRLLEVEVERKLRALMNQMRNGQVRGRRGEEASPEN
jgi:hypothetical protein